MKYISIMLDLEGTLDNMNDDLAKIFINQVDTIRKYLIADKAIILISTHYIDSDKIKDNLDILNKHLIDNIKIGKSFYLGGMYDYNRDTDTYINKYFNYDKEATFHKYYKNSIWFALIDDMLLDTTFKKYQRKQPMLVCRPTQRRDYYNNFMSIATNTYGFNGVVECLNIYINSIKGLTLNQILEKQKTMVYHVNQDELKDIIKNKDYNFIEKYFKLGLNNKEDYNFLVTRLLIEIQKKYPTKQELIKIRNIVNIISTYCNNSKISEKIKELKRII